MHVKIVYFKSMTKTVVSRLFMRRKAQCKTNVNSIFIFSPILLFFSLLIKDYERIVKIIKRLLRDSMEPKLS